MQNSIFCVRGLSPTGTKGCAWAKLILNPFSYKHYKQEYGFLKSFAVFLSGFRASVVNEDF